MFAYGRTSIRYTIYVAIVFTVCGGFWLIAWFFYNRIGQTQEIDLSTGAEITLWNHTIRTTVSMSIMMLGVLVLVPIFASAQFGIDFLILLVSLVPSVFVSISHYNFMIFLLSRLFIEYISILLKISVKRMPSSFARLFWWYGSWFCGISITIQWHTLEIPYNIW